MPDSLKDLEALFPVSRETGAKLQLYAELLRQWQKTQNLVSPKSLEALWIRHMTDSVQLLPLSASVPEWIDMGSGAGFPGLVIAIASEGLKKVTLIEANQGKAAFLREVLFRTATPGKVISSRLEQAGGTIKSGPKTISARALAPLAKLCELISPYFDSESVALFPKGRNLKSELVAAQKEWMMDFSLHPSITDPEGQIFRLTGLVKKAKT